MRKMRLYVLLSGLLTAGEKLAQAVHAATQFAEEHPAIYRAWYDQSRHIVVLQGPDDLSGLASEVETGHKVTRVLEPDLGGALTALAVEPGAWRRLSSLPLAR